MMALCPRPPTIPPVLRPVEAAAREVLLRLHPTEEAERRRHRVQIEAGSFFPRLLLFGRHGSARDATAQLLPRQGSHYLAHLLPISSIPSLTRLVSKGVARALGHVFVVAVGMLPLLLDLGGGERPERERPPSPRSRASSSRKVLQ